jgi:hypothetical protein
VHDGSIVFNTKIDNSDVEKDLKATEKKIRSAEDSIYKNENAKMPLVKQAEQLGAKLDEAKRNLEYIRAEMSAVQTAMMPGSGVEDYTAAAANYERVKVALDAQEKEVQDLQKEWDKVNNKVDEYDLKIERSRHEIERCTAEAGRLRSKLTKGGNSISGLFVSAEKSAHNFGKRILSIGMSAFVFNVLSDGLRSAVGYMGRVLQTNKEYTTQLKKLKAAILTAFQPIYEFVLPGLIMVLKILTAIVTMFAKFLSWLFGKSLSDMAQNAENLYKEAAALDAVGTAAKAAKRELAGFDEINRLGESPDISTGTGSGAIVPDFGDMEGGAGEISNTLDTIFELVTAIGAGFLAWKIASAFTEDLSKIAGIAMAVGGSVKYAFDWWDAFTNGIDWENLLSILIDMGFVVGGLTLAFGSTGGAVGLLITSFGLLGLAMYEWITTGELTNEALTALELGLLGVGIALSILTGSWIPLLVAAIIGFVTLVVTRADEIKAKLAQLDTWLQTVFTNDWRNVFGPVIGTILNNFCSFLQEKWNIIRDHLNGWIDFLKGVFTGDWRQAWDGVKQIFNSVFNSLPDTVRSVVNTIISLVSNAISRVNQLISAINRARSMKGGGFSSSVFSGYFAKGGVLRSGWGIVGEAGPEIIEMVGGRAVITPLNIPYLAQGAVLPANKPFMAMVGDQRHGTNIEAPLSTIQEAVGLVMADQLSAMMAGFEAVVQAIQEKNMAVVIGDSDIGEANARYSRRMEIRRGG